MLPCIVFGTLLFAQSTSNKNTKAARIQLIDNLQKQRVDVLVEGKLFTAYIYPGTLKKPVLYPINTSAGTPVTRGWPMDPRPGERVDHPHQVGMWFNYGDVNGYDFWNNSNNVSGQAGKYGTIKHDTVLAIKNGNNAAQLTVAANWLNDAGTVLLKEQTTFIFSGKGADRSIERITTLTAASNDVLFNDNKEGLIGLRVARQLEHPGKQAEIFTDASGTATKVPQINNDGVTGHYLSSNQKEGDAVWGTRGGWVSLRATIGTEPVSVLIMDNPKNIGHPTYWHARGYGLFAANPLGQSAFSNGKETLRFNLPAGQSVTFKFKILIHSGSLLNYQQANAYYTIYAK